MNCCDYGCNQGKDCPARRLPIVAGNGINWAKVHPHFQENGTDIHADEPSARETLIAFFADGWRYMVISSIITLLVTTWVFFQALGFTLITF